MVVRDSQFPSVALHHLSLVLPLLHLDMVSVEDYATSAASHSNSSRPCGGAWISQLNSEPFRDSFLCPRFHFCGTCGQRLGARRGATRIVQVPDGRICGFVHYRRSVPINLAGAKDGA